jgi:hypothetical protein
MAITLNGTTGIQNVLGSAAAPAESNTTSSNTGVYFPTSTSVGISTAGVNAVTVNASQNVGIGTTSITSYSGYTTLAINNATNGGLIDFYTAGASQGQIFSSATEMRITKTGANYITAYTNGLERMRIDSSGNLLVGVTSTVNSSILTVQNGAAGGVNSSFVSGTTASTYQIIFANPNGNVGSIVTNGSTTAFNTSSDQRLKENIQDAESASSLIDSLQVRKFDWKTDSTHQRYGFVAQELLAVAPEAVYQPTNTEEMMAVDYSKLVPMLVKEIQTLRTRIAALEAR